MIGVILSCEFGWHRTRWCICVYVRFQTTDILEQDRTSNQPKRTRLALTATLYGNERWGKLIHRSGVSHIRPYSYKVCLTRLSKACLRQVTMLYPQRRFLVRLRSPKMAESLFPQDCVATTLASPQSSLFSLKSNFVLQLNAEITDEALDSCFRSRDCETSGINMWRCQLAYVFVTESSIAALRLFKANHNLQMKDWDMRSYFNSSLCLIERLFLWKSLQYQARLKVLATSASVFVEESPVSSKVKGARNLRNDADSRSEDKLRKPSTSLSRERSCYRHFMYNAAYWLIRFRFRQYQKVLNGLFISDHSVTLRRSLVRPFLTDYSNKLNSAPCYAWRVTQALILWISVWISVCKAECIDTEGKVW